MIDKSKKKKKRKEKENRSRFGGWGQTVKSVDESQVVDEPFTTMMNNCEARDIYFLSLLLI